MFHAHLISHLVPASPEVITLSWIGQIKQNKCIEKYLFLRFHTDTVL